MLQFGGVQAAIIDAPPPDEEAVAEKEVALPRLQFAALVLTEPGSEEHQVRKLPLMTFPRVSVTVAVIAVLLPRARMTVFPPRFVGARVMDWTRQVLKLKGALDTPSMVTKMGLVPGTLAVAVAWPGSNPLTGLVGVADVMFTTLLLTICQMKGPTVEVMSRPGAGPPCRLYAVA